jgi:hypothetical protein
MASLRLILLLFFLSVASATFDKAGDASLTEDSPLLPPSAVNQTAKTLCGKLNFFFVYIIANPSKTNSG